MRRQLDYLRILGGSKEAAKELKLFGLKDFLLQRFTRLSDQIYDENVALSRRKLIAGSFLSMVGTMGYYSAYVYVIWRTVAGALSIGTLTFLTGAILQASSNIQQIFSTLAGIGDQALFVTDLLAFFEMKPTIQSKPHALHAPRPITRGVEFRNVSFSYPGNSRRVLDSINFQLHTNERLALIGENGQGKTTIVKLITRLYDPTEGQILLDGVDLRDYDLEDLHREIGVIFQDFMRYEMTARENIAIGRIEEIDNLELVKSAAEKSMADQTIGRLPGGFDQMLGRRFRARRGSFRRRMAKSRAGSRLFARCSTSNFRRAHRGPRRAQRVRSIPSLCRTHRRKNGAFYFTPLLHRAFGGPHLSSGKWQGSPKKGRTINWPAWAAGTRRCSRCEASSYR